MRTKRVSLNIHGVVEVLVLQGLEADVLNFAMYTGTKTTNEVNGIDRLVSSFSVLCDTSCL